MVDSEEMTIFERLLTYKDFLHSETFDVPFLDEKITVFWMTLTADEIPPVEEPQHFDVADFGTKMRWLNKYQDKKVFTMIDKAQRLHPDKIPKECFLTEKVWEEICEKFPDIRDEIVGRITGSTKRIIESFFGGQKTVESQ